MGPRSSYAEARSATASLSFVRLSSSCSARCCSACACLLGAGSAYICMMLLIRSECAAFDSDAHVSSDALSIYWCSRRGASADIWSATRPSREQPFVEIALVDELNTSLDEDDPWISPDGRTMYFSRGTEFGVEMSLWVSTR